MRRSDPSASRRPAMPSASGEMPSPAAANFVSSLSARYAMSGRPSSRAIARRAATPSAKLENNRDSNRRTRGNGWTRSVACVITPRAPSEPRTSSFRLGPCDSFGTDRTSRTRAGETSRTPTTRSSMLPYRFEWEPDARIAIHPPTVENSHDCGKCPSVRPFAFKASSRGGPRIPASTVATPGPRSGRTTRRDAERRDRRPGDVRDTPQGQDGSRAAGLCLPNPIPTTSSAALPTPARSGWADKDVPLKLRAALSQRIKDGATMGPHREGTGTIVSREGILKVLEAYDPSAIRIATIGSHSALDVCDGAVEEGFSTLVICEKGRSTPYARFFRTTRDKEGRAVRGMVDEAIILSKFQEVLDEKMQDRLRKANAVFIPNRSFTSYCDLDAIERSFQVPLFGSRSLLRTEEREAAQR